MTVSTLQYGRSGWRGPGPDGSAGSPALTGLAVGLLLLALPTALLGLVDERTVGGLASTANVWAKPLKFQLALALQALTIAWALARLHALAVRVPGRSVLIAALVATMLFEVAYITLQGARGEASHFNRGTPLESLCATLMASGANVLVGATAWIGAVALWHWLRPRNAPREPLLLAIGLGFVLMFFLAGFTGAAMGQYRGPFVGGPPGAGTALPLTGWRLDVGDLRIAHFFGVHAMQGLPLLGWLLRGQRRTTAHVVIVAGALGWAVLTAALMQRAEAGRGLWT